MEISDMGVFKMLDAIEAWQADPNVHELTCGSDSCNHVKLVAKIIATAQNINISGQEGSKIILECPVCDYTQDFVPDCVYQYYINTTLSYKIPLGQVVEVDITEGFGADAIFLGKERTYGDGLIVPAEEGVTGGEEIVLCFVGKLRALVVGHSRDCDGTPLYCLSNIRVRYNSSHLPDNIRGRLSETWTYKKHAEYLKTGFPEESLKVIEGQFVPLLFQSIFDYEEDMMSGLK